jgi:hypothetical protein
MVYTVVKGRNCPMLIKHHGCWETMVSSLDGNYYQIAKQSHENYIMKVVFHSNTVNIMNYLHGVE